MRLESNGCGFHCSVEGVSGRPWLVLSHAIATDLSLWDPLVPFIERHYRLLRYDARGHGSSDVPAGDYSLEMMCRDVVGLMDAAGIERAHFLGLSMGGMVALGLALDHAERFHGVICADARAAATDQYRRSWIERSAQVEAGGMEAVVESSVTRWFTGETLRTAPAVVDRARAMIRGMPPSGYRSAAAALMGLDYERRLQDIRLPVLYVVGQQDQGAPPDVMLAMQRQTPRSRFVGIPHAGHLSVLERPEVFATSILGFLHELDSGPKPALRLVGAR